MSEPDDLSERVRRAIHEIVQYMIRHPEARDTLAGIRDWWLPQGIICTEPELQKAVDTLTCWGWLVKQTLVARTVVYGVSEAGLLPAKEYLKGKTDQE